jgi:ABC-type transport system substrate-binding protein
MKRLLLVLPACLALDAAACGGSSSSGSSASGGTSGTAVSVQSGTGTGPVTKGGILKGAVIKDYDYWDGTSYYGDMWAFEFVTGNALLVYPNSVGPDRDQLIPGVASDLPQVSQDGLAYTFKVRQGLKFSNGAPVTPEDVKGTFERSLDPGGQFDAQISTTYYASIAGYDKYTATGSDGKPLATSAKSLSGIEELQPPQLQEIATTPDLKDRFYRNPDSRIDYYWMNAHMAPFDNLKLRQAVNYAIDRQVQGKLLGGAVTGEPWSQILSRPLMKSYVGDMTAYPASPDLAKAKELVQESGVKTPIPVTLAFNNSSPIPAQSASALKNDLQQIGFQVSIKPIDPSAYYQAIQNPKKTIQIGWAGWTQDYTDGSAFFGPLLSSTSVTNYAQFQDKALQASIDKISAMPSGPDREKAWAQLSDQTTRTSAPWAVYDNRNFYELVSNRYGGYASAPTKQRYYALAYVR